MMAGKVVGLGFEIISKLDSYLLMTLNVRRISSFEFYGNDQKVGNTTQKALAVFRFAFAVLSGSILPKTNYSKRNLVA